MAIQIDLRSESCFFLALLCMVLPLKWIVAMIIAGIFHELCHALTVMLLGGKIFRIRIGLSGTIMEISGLCAWKELICALAGPIGSMFLALMLHHVPYTALCALIQGLYNLLPLYPLDGGRALYCTLQMIFPEDRANGYCRNVNMFCGILMAVCGILVMLRIKAGIMPILAILLFLSRSMCGKMPCKDCVPGVQ